MLATTELAPDGTPLDPADLLADATLTVVPSTSLRLRFDRFLLPATLLRQAACLRSNLADVTDFTQCEGGVFLQPAYDPVRREVVLRQPAGDRLELDTAYKLTLFVPDIEGDCTGEDPTSCGFRAFDRAPLEQAYTVTFKTVAVDPGPVPDEAPPCGLLRWGRRGHLLSSAAATPRCRPHLQRRPGAAAGLDLSGLLPGDTFDSFALRATAINRVSHQTQMGERAFDPEETPARFGRAMPIIDAFDPGTAGSPGNSYLLYKLLVGPSMDSAPADIRPSDEEMARLRNGLVVGLPMSADGSKLSGDALLALSNWIARGAPTPKCQ
ncbi:MAG: hypothetical protein R3B70_41075 [Polyangiaceae bacterium]